MKSLIEISRIITRKKVRKIEILDSATLESKNSKFAEFYEALLANKFKNDRDAASMMYGCSPAHDKYRQLKSRFRKRLMNTLFFIDINQPSASGYDRAYFSCHKDWTLIKILMANDAHLSAEELARQLLTTALKFKFADVVVNCSRILRDYAAKAGNDADFEQFDEHISQFSKVLDAEIQSEMMFQRTLLSYVEPVSEVEGVTEKIMAYCESLVGMSEQFDSPIVNYNMYLVWTYRYQMQRDYPAMLQVCEQAEQYIAAHPNYLQEDKLATFHLKRMSAYLHLRDFKNGKTSAEKSLQLFQEGSPVWFEFMEYYLLLAFHTENYVSAWAIYNRARGNAKFKKLDLETKEKWNIYEVFLNYFIEESDQAEILKAQSKKIFKVSRFLNDPILYPREQRVFSIQLVIAQVLFLLEKKEYPLASERIDRLRIYALRQLDEVEHFRPIQFIRLLHLLAKADFQIEGLGNTEKYYDHLVEHPYFYRGLISEMEVVPYEKLWNHVLAKLQD